MIVHCTTHLIVTFKDLMNPIKQGYVRVGRGTIIIKNKMTMHAIHNSLQSNFQFSVFILYYTPL